MIIEWTPSVEITAKAHKIYQLRKAGLTWYKIAEEIGNGRRYCIALYNWYVQQKGGVK